MGWNHQPVYLVQIHCGLDTSEPKICEKPHTRQTSLKVFPFWEIAHFYPPFVLVAVFFSICWTYGSKIPPKKQQLWLTFTGGLKHFWNFHPEPWDFMIQFDKHMFQMGGFNHQLVYLPTLTININQPVGNTVPWKWVGSTTNKPPPGSVTLTLRLPGVSVKQDSFLLPPWAPPKLTFLEGFYGKSPGFLGGQNLLFFMGFGGSWQLQHMFCVSILDQWVLFHPFEFCCG